MITNSVPITLWILLLLLWLRWIWGHVLWASPGARTRAHFIPMHVRWLWRCRLITTLCGHSACCATWRNASGSRGWTGRGSDARIVVAYGSVIYVAAGRVQMVVYVIDAWWLLGLRNCWLSRVAVVGGCLWVIAWGPWRHRKALLACKMAICISTQYIVNRWKSKNKLAKKENKIRDYKITYWR